MSKRWTLWCAGMALSAAACAVDFENRGTAQGWDFLDLAGDSLIRQIHDPTCPPGYGPEALRIEGTRVLALARHAPVADATFVALYRELSPREDDADGVILFRAQYGADVSTEHNVQLLRQSIWLEQDNDSGFQFRCATPSGEEITVHERSGFGLVDEPWNRTGWIWQKVRIDGGRFRAKYWPAGYPEPAEWGIDARVEWPAQGRFGLHTASGKLHLAYFAADTDDIAVAAPAAYLVLPGGVTANGEGVTLELTTNAPAAANLTFAVRATDPSGLVAEGRLERSVPRGAHTQPIELGGDVLPLARPFEPGACRVMLSTQSGQYDAQAGFEVLPAGRYRNLQGALAQQREALEHALENTAYPPRKQRDLTVIAHAAAAHLDLVNAALQDGDLDAAQRGLGFAAEALSELDGYKGLGVPPVDLPEGIVLPESPGKPEDGYRDFYAPAYGLAVDGADAGADSFVMGRRYTVTLRWRVEAAEGVSPDRDFTFHTSLASPLGNRVVAASDAPPEKPTSAWTAATGPFAHAVALELPPEDASLEGHMQSQPPILDEWHRLLVSVADPATGAPVILRNAPGPHPDRPGSSVLVREFFITHAPLEIRGFTPQGTGLDAPERIAVNTEHVLHARIANLGAAPWSGRVVLSAVSETGRVLHYEVLPVEVEAGAEAPVETVWTPSAVGRHTLWIQLWRGGHIVTQARRPLQVDPPPGFAPTIRKAAQVELRGRRFAVPVTACAGQQDAGVTVDVYVDGEQRASGRGRGEAAAYPEPWFGYYDVHADFGAFDMDRRLVATCVEAVGADLLVNGEPFIVKGVNVHGMDASSPVKTAAMMRTMRDLGFNLWRGDYPPRWQIDLAYELNTAYDVLAPFSCASTEEIFRRQAGPPLTTARELTRVFVQRYADSAGVLFWNSCNEIGGETPHFLVSLYPVCRAFDEAQRPVHYANLYGQDLWHGQDFAGVNYYFGVGQRAVNRQPLIARSTAIMAEHGLPTIYTEFNSYHGAVHSTGVEAMRDLFAWGVDQGMAGGVLYMKGNSDRHPGVFDHGINTHKIFDEAIVDAFADAEVALERVDRARIMLAVRNKRGCTLRDVHLDAHVSGLPVGERPLPDIGPRETFHASLRMPPDAPGPGAVVEGVLRFVTHFGFQCRVPFRVLIETRHRK